MTETFSVTPATVLTHGRVMWKPDLQCEWSNSGCSLCFCGDRIVLHFEPLHGGESSVLYYCVELDGTVLSPRQLTAETGDCTVETVEGEHRLRIRHRSEAIRATEPLCLHTVSISGIKPALLPPPAPAPLRLEFLGDSITCGFGNDQAADEPFRAEGQDSTRTYGALIAAALHADDRHECISSQGVTCNSAGEHGYLLSEYFTWNGFNDRTPCDFAAWQPHAVVVNIGTNDEEGGVDHEVYRRGMLAFLKQLREAYPTAYIVWIYGMIHQTLDGVTRTAIAEFNDARTAYVPMDSMADKPELTGSCGHPNLLSHRLYAEQLLPVLRQLLNAE